MIGYRTVSLAEQVYDRIEHDILTGKYAQGEVISEKRLSEELGVSRTPIREAMSRLAHEKLIKDSTNGTIVVGVTENDVRDLMAVKTRIETLAVRRAAEYITDEEIKELKDNVEQQEFFAQKKDAEKVRDLDTQFHDVIYQASRSITFETILIPIHHKMLKFRKFSLEKENRIYDSVAEHRALYEAIADRDADRAETLVSIHIDHVFKSMKGEK